VEPGLDRSRFGREPHDGRVQKRSLALVRLEPLVPEGPWSVVPIVGTNRAEEGPMLLVPRQLQRSGMTGSVPYYGGRFTPAQAWAAAHPSAPPGVQRPAAPGVGTGRALVPPRRPETSEGGTTDTKSALRHLHESGVLTAEEYDELLSRTSR